mmetsp:Transcript_26256/g.39348  ORF Transcript_26256/g.39348 Transcript_26256/m.39348 type:complete len:117 (-) Transcript_26256:138-488(-)
MCARMFVYVCMLSSITLTRQAEKERDDKLDVNVWSGEGILPSRGRRNSALDAEQSIPKIVFLLDVSMFHFSSMCGRRLSREPFPWTEEPKINRFSFECLVFDHHVPCFCHVYRLDG